MSQLGVPVDHREKQGTTSKGVVQGDGDVFQREVNVVQRDGDVVHGDGDVVHGDVIHNVKIELDDANGLCEEFLGEDGIYYGGWDVVARTALADGYPLFFDLKRCCFIYYGAVCWLNDENGRLYYFDGDAFVYLDHEAARAIYEERVPWYPKEAAAAAEALCSAIEKPSVNTSTGSTPKELEVTTETNGRTGHRLALDLSAIAQGSIAGQSTVEQDCISGQTTTVGGENSFSPGGASSPARPLAMETALRLVLTPRPNQQMRDSTFEESAKYSPEMSSKKCSRKVARFSSTAEESFSGEAKQLLWKELTRQFTVQSERDQSELARLIGGFYFQNAKSRRSLASMSRTRAADIVAEFKLTDREMFRNASLFLRQKYKTNTSELLAEWRKRSNGDFAVGQNRGTFENLINGTRDLKSIACSDFPILTADLAYLNLEQWPLLGSFRKKLGFTMRLSQYRPQRFLWLVELRVLGYELTAWERSHDDFLRRFALKCDNCLATTVLNRLLQNSQSEAAVATPEKVADDINLFTAADRLYVGLQLLLVLGAHYGGFCDPSKLSAALAPPGDSFLPEGRCGSFDAETRVVKGLDRRKTFGAPLSTDMSLRSGGRGIINSRCQMTQDDQEAGIWCFLPVHPLAMIRKSSSPICAVEKQSLRAASTPVITKSKPTGLYLQLPSLRLTPEQPNVAGLFKLIRSQTSGCGAAHNWQILFFRTASEKFVELEVIK